MRFAHLLAAQWMDEYQAAPRKAKAYDTALRNSDAGDCSRSLTYDLRGFEPEGFDEPGVWVTRLGELVHAAWQDALKLQYPDASVELKVGYDGGLTSGHLDAFVVVHFEDDWRIALELKTVNGTAFRRAVGAPSGRGSSPEPMGPRTGDVTQLAINALMAEADEARLCYVAMEAIAIGKGFQSYDRFCAEWSYERSDFEPIARRELERYERIVAEAAKPGVPWPEYEGKIISPPGEAVFPCLYCGHRPRCLEDSRDR